MAGHMEDIGLGRGAFPLETPPSIEAGIRERVDIESESSGLGFRVTPELALDIANAVFLSWRYDDWGSVFLELERTEYRIRDLGNYYVVSRSVPNVDGVSKHVAICKTNGRIIQIFIH